MLSQRLLISWRSSSGFTCHVTSFLTFRRHVLFLLGQNLVQADAELAGKERMCPSAHIIHCRPLQGLLNHSHSILLPAPTALTGQRFSQLPHIGVTFVPSQPPQYLPELHSRTLKTEPVGSSKTPKNLPHGTQTQNKVTKCAKYFK